MANQSSAVVVSLADIATYDTQFRVPLAESGKLSIDALSATLARARSVLLLLQCNGEDVKAGFELNHTYVMDALWCVDGLITQAQALVDQVEIVKSG